MKLIYLVALFSCLVIQARATEVIPPDFKTMVKQAQVVFEGTVTGVRSEWSEQAGQRCIVSYVTFDVSKTLKGSAPSPYVLQMLGGTIGDQAMEVDGVPKFKVGDETLLFVENNGTQFFPVVGIMHGYFRLQASAGKDVVLKYNGQPLQSTADIDSAHQQALKSGGAVTAAKKSSGPAMTRNDFEAAIRKAVTNP